MQTACTEYFHLTFFNLLIFEVAKILPSLDCSLTELLLEPVIANVVGLMELVVVVSPFDCWNTELPVLASSGIGVGGAGFVGA